MSGMLAGMLKGKAASKVMGGSGGQTNAGSLAQDQTVAGQLFEEIFQPTEIPAFESGATDAEILQTLLNLFKDKGVNPTIGY